MRKLSVILLIVALLLIIYKISAQNVNVVKVYLESSLMEFENIDVGIKIDSMPMKKINIRPRKIVPSYSTINFKVENGSHFISIESDSLQARTSTKFEFKKEGHLVVLLTFIRPFNQGFNLPEIKDRKYEIHTEYFNEKPFFH